MSRIQTYFMERSFLTIQIRIDKIIANLTLRKRVYHTFDSAISAFETIYMHVHVCPISALNKTERNHFRTVLMNFSLHSQCEQLRRYSNFVKQPPRLNEPRRQKTIGFPNRFDTNRPVQLQKMARSLKLRI